MGVLRWPIFFYVSPSGVIVEQPRRRVLKMDDEADACTTRLACSLEACRKQGSQDGIHGDSSDLPALQNQVDFAPSAATGVPLQGPSFCPPGRGKLSRKSRNNRDTRTA